MKDKKGKVVMVVEEKSKKQKQGVRKRVTEAMKKENEVKFKGRMKNGRGGERREEGTGTELFFILY